MNRRHFLGALTRTAAGLLVAEDALELIAPARRYWPGADLTLARPLRYQSAPAMPLSVEQLNAVWRALLEEYGDIPMVRLP